MFGLVFANMLVILMIDEAGLRSMLAARLALSGADVVSMESVDPVRVGRLTAQSPTLVADAVAAARHPGGIAALAADRAWCRLVLIGAEPEGTSAPHVHHVRTEDPVASITALLDLSETQRSA